MIQLNSTAIILAGGKSSRMGKNKALLSINGKTIIENIVDRVREVVDEMIIVTNSMAEYEFLQLPMVEDHPIHKGMGPLAGIEAGLTTSKSDRNLVVACDMPFISEKVAAYLLSCLDEYDCEAVVPVISGQMHPLFGAYRKNVRDALTETLEEKRLSLIPFLSKVNAKIINEETLKQHGLPNEELLFFNMNHPSEYDQAVKFFKKQR